MFSPNATENGMSLSGIKKVALGNILFVVVSPALPLLGTAINIF